MLNYYLILLFFRFITALEWDQWGDWQATGTTEEQELCAPDGTRGIETRTRGCIDGTVEECISTLAGKQLEEQYSRVYYACHCMYSDSFSESRFYMELLFNSSGFITSSSTDIEFQVAVPVQFHDVRFSFNNATYNRAAYPGDDPETSYWQIVQESESCDQPEIWQANIAWDVLHSGQGGGVFEMFSYPVYNNEGELVEWIPYERMWGFELVMQAKEVFRANSKLYSRTIDGDKELEFRLPLIVKFQLRVTIESSMFQVFQCSQTMRDPRCDERILFSISEILQHSTDFNTPPYAVVDLLLSTKSKYPYKLDEDSDVPLYAQMDLDPNPPYMEQTLYGYTGPGTTTQGLNELRFQPGTAVNCEYPDDGYDDNYECSIQHLDTNSWCWDDTYQCNECCGTNNNQAGDYCWAGTGRDGTSREACCGISDVDIDYEVNNLWCEQQWLLTLEPGNCYVSGTYTLLYTLECFENKPAACAFESGTRTLENGIVLTDRQVAITFDVESSRMCPTMVDRIDLSGEICLTCVASTGFPETYCGQLDRSGYGCSYVMGDRVNLEVFTSSEKASIYQSEIVAIYIQNYYDNLDSNIEYDERMNVTGGYPVWTESNNDGYFEVYYGDVFQKEVKIVENVATSDQTGNPLLTAFDVILDNDLFPVSPDGYNDFDVFVTVRVEYEGYIARRRRLQGDDVEANVTTTLEQEPQGRDEFLISRKIRVSSDVPAVSYFYHNENVHTFAPTRVTLTLTSYDSTVLKTPTESLEADLNKMVQTEGQIKVGALYPSDDQTWTLQLYIYPTHDCTFDQAPLYLTQDLLAYVRAASTAPFYTHPFFSDKKVTTVVVESEDSSSINFDASLATCDASGFSTSDTEDTSSARAAAASLLVAVVLFRL